MFQRLKGAIDSRIAEEQARSRLSQSSPSRSDASAKRSISRAVSPTKGRPSQAARGRQDGDPSAKGPDPAVFEPEYIIEDDELSRSGTPRPAADKDGNTASKKASQDNTREIGQETTEEKATTEDTPRTSFDLPTDVRVKLRKLDKLESKYHELLRSYRVAHARVLNIEPFEKSLRENTPLTSIGDPRAFAEYLNQINLKGDMVLDELKRVSNARDSFKQKLSEAEKSTKEAWDEVGNLRNLNVAKDEHENVKGQTNDSLPENGATTGEIIDGEPLEVTAKTPPPSVKSPTASIRGMSLFSPKANPVDSPKFRQGSEDLFSYDGEIPRLETELQDRQQKISCLENEVKSLEGDLAVTRESTQSMVQTLEEATRELNILRESKDRSDSDMKERQISSERVLEQLRNDLNAAKNKLLALQTENTSRDSSRINELDEQLQIARQELEIAQSAAKQNPVATSQTEELQLTITQLEAEITGLREDGKKSEKKIDTLNGLVGTLRAQLAEAEDKNQDLYAVIEKSSKAFGALQGKVEHFESKPEAVDKVRASSQPNGSNEEISMQGSQGIANDLLITHEPTNANKKKTRKKKKAGKSAVDQDKEHHADLKSEPDASVAQGREPSEPDTVGRLQEELRRLRITLEEKDIAIDRMHGKLKDEEGLREEIDTLRDDLVNVGQEHVEAKDRVKELTAEKLAIEARVTTLEKELVELRGSHASSTAGSEERHKYLTDQFEDLKVKATTLQTDLSAAQQLASSRFKDLNDLRNILQKAQPEINTLRSEAAEMKSVKEALSRKDAEFKRLDSRHEEMRSEVNELKHLITDREAEIKLINQKVSYENNSRVRAEDASSKAAQEVQRLDTAKQQATESLDRLSRELTKAREELLSSKSRLRDLEQQLSQIRSDSEGWKEEIELKSAQYASAQSLMASMRDQTAEMAVQMKEARERCESLDEEVADAHRLLGERSREGETMRRLLVDVEGKADARTREMKERMDTAIEERDRAEDEASTAGRRRARELEDLKNKCRDIERNLKRAEEDKEELQISQRDWKRRREELEYRAGQSTKEVDEIRKAMGELQDALDESERQAREMEKQKAELRRSVEDTQHRLEKLQKSNKSMADEIGKIQTAKTRAIDSEAHSSRSSLDSAARIASPAPKSRTPSAALVDAPNGQPPGTMDYVYLKNVLLQFLEQKDKKHQIQLIPVLGMLLHFDRKDEQKWMSAITTK